MHNNHPLILKNPPFDYEVCKPVAAGLYALQTSHTTYRARSRWIKSRAASKFSSPVPPSLCEGAEGRGHGQGRAPAYRRRRDEEGPGGAAERAAEAELVVAGHRAGRGVGAAAARDCVRWLGAAARPERHGRRPCRAPRVHRSGFRVRAVPRLRGVRRRQEPTRGDAPRAGPLLRRARRRRSGGGRVLVRRRVGGVVGGIASRQPHVHSLAR